MHIDILLVLLIIAFADGVFVEYIKVKLWNIKVISK